MSDAVNAQPVAAPEAAPAAESGAPTPEAAPQATPEPRKFKLKVNGEEVEANEDEVLKWAQMGRAANTKFQEAAQLRKEVEQFQRDFVDNPKEALKGLRGKSPKLREAVEEFLYEELQEEKLTPEQKAQRERDERLKKYEEAEAKRKQEEEERATNDLQQKYAQEYDTKISKALETSGLPRTPGTIKRVAEYMMQALDAGMDLDPTEAIELVRNDYAADIKELLGGLDEATVLSLLGDGIAGKLRKADLARVKSPKAERPAEQPAPSAPRQEQPKKISSAQFKDEIFKAIERL